MKSTKTGSVHQVIVGRATLTESSQGYPQIRKEQVKEEGKGRGGKGGRRGKHFYFYFCFSASYLSKKESKDKDYYYSSSPSWKLGREQMT